MFSFIQQVQISSKKNLVIFERKWGGGRQGLLIEGCLRARNNSVQTENNGERVEGNPSNFQ